jgi:hypothetical protein
MAVSSSGTTDFTVASLFASLTRDRTDSAGADTTTP